LPSSTSQRRSVQTTPGVALEPKNQVKMILLVQDAGFDKSDKKEGIVLIPFGELPPVHALKYIPVPSA
jgi:hypothetical protein